MLVARSRLVFGMAVQHVFWKLLLDATGRDYAENDDSHPIVVFEMVCASLVACPAVNGNEVGGRQVIR